MSHYDYKQSKDLSILDPSFAALIMAAARKADSTNFEKLENAFPEIVKELKQRYNAPGGYLEGEN